MADSTLRIRIEGDSRDAEAALRRIKGALGDVGPTADRQTGLVGRLTGALGKIGLASIGIQSLIGVFGNLGSVLSSGPIGAASDLSESINKLNVVLGDSADEVMAWAETSAQAFGQSKNQAIAAAAGFSNLFVTMGKGQGEAADLSMGIVSLASDLASFNNMPVDEALEKLRAGLVGEAEPLRSLGVNINAAAVEAEGLALGIVGVGEEMTDAQKITARYSLIMKQTATAQGDFAETSTGLANAQRIISASFEDLQAQIGSRLLPLIAPLVSAFATGLPAAIDTLNGVLDALGGYFHAVIEDGDYLNDMLMDLPGPIRGVVAGIGKLVAGVKDFLAYLDPSNTVDFMGNLLGPDFGPIVDEAVRGIKSVADVVGRVIELGGLLVGGKINLGEFFGSLGAALSRIDMPDFAAILGNVGDIVSGLATTLGDAVAGIPWGTVWAKAKDVGAGLVAGLGSIIGSIQTWVGEQFAGINWDGIWSGAVDLGSGLITGLGSIGGDILQWVKDQWATLADKWPTIWAGAGNIVMGLLASVTDFGGRVVTWITEAWAFLKDKWPDVWKGAGDIVAGLLASVADFGGDVVAWVTEAWGKLSAAWPDIWKGAGDIGAGLVASGLSIVADVQGWLEETWAAIGWAEVWGAADSFVSTLATFVADAVEQAFTTAEVQRTDAPGIDVAIKDLIENLRVGLYEGSRTVGADIMEFLLGGFLEADWASIGGRMRERINSFFMGEFMVIFGPAGILMPVLVTAISGAFTGAVEGLRATVAEKFGPLGSAIVEGIIFGLGGFVPALIEAAGGMINQLIATVTGLLESGSPSQVFVRIGQDIVNGLVAGVAGLPAAVATAVGGIATKIAETAGTVLTGATTLGTNIVTGLTTGAAGLLAALGTLLGQITGWITSTGETVLTSAAAIGASIVNGLRAGAEILTAKLGEIWATIDGWITQTAATILGSAAAIGRDLASGVRNGAKIIGEKLGEVWATIDGWITETAENVLATAAGIGRNLAQGVINGIDELIDAAKKKAEEIGNIITGALKTVTGQSSPSKVTAETGRMIGEGLIAGMEARLDAVRQASKALGKSALEGIDAVVDSGMSRLGGSEIAWANPSGASMPLPAMASSDSPAYWGARPAGGQAAPTTVNNYNTSIHTQATHVDIPTELGLVKARHAGRY